MRSSTQSTLWTFVTAYKSALGEGLSYIRLVQDSDYLRRAITRAREHDDAELQELARQLEAALTQEGEPGPSTANRSTPPASGQSAGGEASQASKQSLHEDYAELVRGALENAAPPSLDDREALDQFVRRNRLNATTAEAIENDVRRQMDLPPHTWAEELRGNVARLSEQGQLDERRRLRIYDIYIKRGRLSVAHAEAVMAEVAPARTTAGTGESANRGNKWTIGIGAAAAVLLAVVVGFSWMSPNVTRAGDADRAHGVFRVSAPITRDTTWKSGNTYELADIIFVEAGATLRIEPNVTVKGEFGSALVITRNAMLQAKGRPDQPIVFTSTRPRGERHPGDWGGVVLLGQAPVNVARAHVEGVPRSDARGAFGGSKPAHACGVLEYVRIEFAGHEVFANNELNGLTLGGCGSNTVLRNIQVHRGLDDGIEFFGGTANLAKAVITGSGDDGLDWDMGWQGQVQHLVVQQYPGVGDNAIEADNWKQKPNAKPRSQPTLYNVTLLGPNRDQGKQRGMTLRRGTGAQFHNLLVAGFPQEVFDVQGAVTASLASAGELSFSHVLIATPGERLFQGEDGKANDDGGFSELAFLKTAAASSHIDLDPGLPSTAFSQQSPRYAPLDLSPAANAGTPAPQSEFWDESATYIGAVQPGDGDRWPQGWTAFPRN